MNFKNKQGVVSIRMPPLNYSVALVQGSKLEGQSLDRVIAMIICRNIDRPGNREYDLNPRDLY